MEYLQLPAYAVEDDKVWHHKEELQEKLTQPHSFHSQLKVEGKQVLQTQIDHPVSHEVDEEARFLDSKSTDYSFEHGAEAVWDVVESQDPTYLAWELSYLCAVREAIYNRVCKQVDTWGHKKDRNARHYFARFIKLLGPL